MPVILDCSDNNPDLNPVTLSRYAAAFIKLYGVNGNISYTARNILIAVGEGKPWALYSADQTLTWKTTVQAVDELARRIGVKLGEIPLYLDWWEWLVGPNHRMNPLSAARWCNAGVTAAHLDGYRVGLYGSEYGAWHYFRQLGLTSDSKWVAHVGQRPAIPFDLWQSGKGIEGDINQCPTSVATLFAQTTGKDEADVTPEQVQAMIADALQVDGVPSAQVYALRWQGFYDRLSGDPAPRKPKEDQYMVGWNLAKTP